MQEFDTWRCDATSADFHGILLHLEKVASAQDVQQHFCNNANLELRANLIGNAFTLMGHDLRKKHGDTTTVISSCKGCNLPYELMDNSDGERKYHYLDANKDKSLVRDIHFASIYLLLASKLIGCSSLLTPEQRNYFEQRFLCQESTPNPGCPPFSLFQAQPLLASMEVIGGCAFSLPTCARSAGAVLSIMMFHRPGSALPALLNPDRLCNALIQYFYAINRRITSSTNTHRTKDIILFISAFLQILPLLYYLADWRETIPFIDKYDLPNQVFVMFQKMAPYVSSQLLCTSARMVDQPSDCSLMPDMVQCVNLAEELYGKDGLVSHRPTSMAIVGCLEVLVRWKRAGVAGVATAFAKSQGQDSRITGEYMNALSDRTPSLHFGVELFADLLKHQTIPQEPKDSVFRGENVFCHLASCTKTENLRRCTGCGLACYCCADHQRDHWYWHKGFCKKQKKLLSKKKGS